ncbi:hypothetical protein [Streptomyces sp. NPDC049040]|uniref:hypothetical protein n=1 Tax=Streptomyces sp. NPDC049040 TaxID=3365593 RepID=UPI0037205E42
MPTEALGPTEHPYVERDRERFFAVSVRRLAPRNPGSAGRLSTLPPAAARGISYAAAHRVAHPTSFGKTARRVRG